MTTLTIITGTIDEAEDPFHHLNISELFYESWNWDLKYKNRIAITREPVPVKIYNEDVFRIVQYLGSGKTLLAVNILANKIMRGEKVKGNLALVWNNLGKPKPRWRSDINSLEDLDNLEKCTFVLDDIKSTISSWNCKEANFIAKIAAGARKDNLDIIITAQREKMVPPELRDIATDWLVPIIRVRDYTRKTPDNTGYPIEMIYLQFDGAKILKGISEPLIGLSRLFEAYSTLQHAESLKIER